LRHQQLLRPPGKGRQASVLSLFDYCLSLLLPDLGYLLIRHSWYLLIRDLGDLLTGKWGFFAHPRLDRFAYLEMGVFC
jgi:hypothetical protein